MTTTSNFEITHLDASQTGKEATINAAWNRIDKRLAGVLIHNMTLDANYVLDTTSPAYEHQNYLIRITDTGTLLSTSRVIQFPANKGPYVLDNRTAFTLNARVGGAGGFVACASSTLNRIFSDGTDMLLTAGAGPQSVVAVPYDFTFFLGGIPTPFSGLELLRIPLTRSIIFPSALTLSKGKALVSATAETVFSFKKNGTTFATATFAIAATTPVFACATDTTFIAGDIFTCDGPASIDLSLANIGFSLATTRA